MFKPSKGPSVGVGGAAGKMHSAIILINRESGLWTGFWLLLLCEI